MTESPYFPLLIVFVIAWTVPLVLSRLEISKIPSVIVEIVMGVVVGPFVLNLVQQTPSLAFLSQMGFLFLIFLSGLEIDVNKIISSLPKRGVKWIDLISNSILLSSFIYFGSLALAVGYVLLVSGFMTLDIAFFALLLPTVALSIVVPILKADGELPRKYGQILLMAGAIATVMSIIILSIYAGVKKNGFEVELLLFTIIFFVFFITYYIGKRVLRIRAFQRLMYRLEHAASQIRVRGTVALLMLFVVIAAAIDTELIMGAFFAGTLLSMFVIKERSALLFKLDGMSYGFFIPVFFIMVGVNLDISALSNFQSSLPFIGVLVVGVFLTQVIPAIVMVRIFGWKKAMAGGLLLSSRLGLTIASAQVALNLGAIDSAQNAGIVAASIVLSLVAPLGYKLLNTSHEHTNHIYLVGGSRANLLLAERLSIHGISYIAVLDNDKIIADFDRKNAHFKKVDDLEDYLRDEIELHVSDLVVILTASRTWGLRLTRIVRNELNHSKIITRLQSAAHDLLDEQGNVKLIDQDEVFANHVEDMIVRPDSIGSITHSFENYGVEEIHVQNQKIVGKQVKEIAFPKTGSLMIHRRKNEVFIPHGDTHLLEGDVVSVIGNKEALIEFRRILEGVG